MADELPEPKSRKESYLAKAAGMSVDIPEPESREEQYLNAIANGGGGGGGDSYTAGNGITINRNVISGNQIHTLTEDDATGTYFGQKYVQAWSLPSGVYLYKGDSNFFVSFYLAQDENDDDDVTPTRDKLELMDGIIIANKGEGSNIVVLRTDAIYGSFSVSSSGELLNSKFPPTNFQGADEERNGESGLVPAPTSNDYDKFLSGSGIWQAIGGFNILTEDDYNWEDPQTGDEYVALWLLPTGHYTTNEDSPNVVASSLEQDGDYLPNDSVAVEMSPLIIINNNDPGNTYPDIMIIYPDYIVHYIIDGYTGLIDSVQEYGAPFIGTGGDSDGTPGLVPAPTTADVGKFLKSDGTWANAGGDIKELSTADYNYPANNPDKVALWLLEPGLYKIPRTGVSVYYASNSAWTAGTLGEFVIIEQYHAGLSPMTMYFFGSSDGMYFTEVSRSGNLNRARAYTLLSDMVVQTTGTSTTDVMSQDATTKLVYPLGASYKDRVGIGLYANPNSTQAVAVGAGAIVQESNGVAIGNSAYVGHKYSVALGDDTKTTRQGEVFIGCENNNHGYNNTKFRVIGGVHDGQTAHDAATVAQGNTLATTAPDTSTVGVLGQLYTDTTNMHTYQCTAISGSTYTWTQRW